MIAEQLFAGRVDVPRGYQFAAYGEMYIADFPKPRYDAAAARRLLKEAGYAGEPIEYRTLPNYYTAELATAQVLQQMWQEVGFTINLKVVENWNQIFAQPNHAIFNGSINMAYPDTMGTLFVFYGPNGFIRNQAKSWRSDAYDAIGDALAKPVSVDTRRGLHARTLELFDSLDPPGTVLHESAMLYGKRRNISWAPQRTPAMDFGPFNPGLKHG